MATYYVGPAAAGAEDGSSWANRLGTLNGAEDIPVAAGDIVYVGPGVYREMLTCDVSGSSGSPITYIGDYTGANTDGVGGVVRITGSDDDQTATRVNCIVCTAQRNYRTFRGFAFDMTTSYLVTGGLSVSGTNWIIDECHFASSGAASGYNLVCGGANQAAWTVSNCMFMGGRSNYMIWFYHSADVSDTGHVVENCIVLGAGEGGNSPAIGSTNVGGITVRNTLVSHARYGIAVMAALAAGQTVTVNNCIIQNCYIALVATTTAEFSEDYNCLYDNTAARSNVNVGANSNTYPPLLDTRWFFEAVNGGTLVTPWDLSSWSQLVNVAGTSPTTADLRGTTVQGAQREWGALEYDSTLDIEAGSSSGGRPAFGDRTGGKF